MGVPTLMGPGGVPPYRAFRLDHARPGDNAPEEALRAATLRLVLDLNRAEAAHLPRHYQREVATIGRFPLAAPIDPGRHRYAGCLYFAINKSIAYAFAGPAGRAWLITGGASHGYRIVAAFYEASRMLFLLEPPGNRVGAFEDGQVKRILGTSSQAFRDPEAPPAAPVLVSGFGNFAHYLWNELPALLELLRGRALALREAVVVAEPFGPFERLVGWPDGVAVTRGNERSWEAIPVVHDLLVTPGSTLVTPHARTRALAAAADVAGTAASARRSDRSRPLLWFSLRTMYRCAMNQEDLLLALGRRMAADMPGWDIALDGLSLPWDINFPARHDLRALRSHARETEAIGARVTPRLRAAAGEALRVFDWTGVSLPEAMLLAGQASYYVCNHGTQQHKIGWLYDTPGLIHGSPHFATQSGVAAWTQSQGGATVRPDYVPARFVTDAVTRNERQHMPEFRDYAFTDVKGLAAYIVDRIRACVNPDALRS